MTGPYDAALEELHRQRELIDEGIAILQRLRDGMPVQPRPAVPERRTETKPAPIERRRGPKPVESDGSDILAAVKKAGGAIAPGALADQLNIDTATLRVHTAPLIIAGRLVVNGTTLSRRYALPGHAPKEAP